ncbi:hypothetical protein, partial [Klebsiella pneumoniae]|uniref:hypothetical protein n=1 Tax=Klebsiella pneumoniae TaxID=573 RepID=UPI00197AB168
ARSFKQTDGTDAFQDLTSSRRKAQGKGGIVNVSTHVDDFSRCQPFVSTTGAGPVLTERRAEFITLG